MKKQIFISCLIVAFFNYINGCSVKETQRIPPEILHFEKEIVEEAVLLNFDVVKFDENGGTYEKAPDLIAGKLIDGKSFQMPVDDIGEFRISTVEPTKLADLEHQIIKEILLKNNVLVVSNAEGARYSKEKGSISGITDNGQSFEIKIDKVSGIYLEKPDTMSKAGLNQNKDIKLSQVLEKKNNQLYIFNQDGGKYISQKRFITGYTPDRELVFIDPDSVLYLNVQRTNVAGTILANLGLIAVIAGGIVLLILATKQSCPFIYSFDGDKYVFDAEPLGGATSRGLERTEYSKMEYLKALDNKYKILVRNEVEETQYIDELSLLAVEHDGDKEVLPDLNGNFYQIKDPVLPVSASDEKGMDLLRVISSDDNLYWQTKLPIDSGMISKSQRHELTFTFPKPNDKPNARLIVNIGTSLWGSRMIREMLQLYGNFADNYYQKINELGSEYEQMMNFIESEELYKLKYYTKTGENWKFQGFINGGGPLVSETRVYDLDLSENEGDSVIVKVNPPYGFWTIDYMAVQYEEYPVPEIKTITLEKALNQDGINLSGQLKSKDGDYVIMPAVGDYFEANFSRTSNEFNPNESYFLKSTGYYEIHLDKSKPFEFTTLSKFVTDPGFIVKYSNEIYRNWKRQNE